MTRKISGERSLKVGGDTVTLRFPIASIMALEDHFDCAIFDLLQQRFGSGTPRLGDVVVLYGAARGIAPDDVKGLEKAHMELQQAGFEEAMTVLMECLSASLGAESGGKPKKPTKAPGKMPAQTRRKKPAAA